MKDASQKNLVFKHFSQQNWFALPEIPVYFTGGEFQEKKLITDLDVFGLRPSSQLGWEVLLADCKTLKGQSPANRAIWLRGLMSQYSSRQGIVVLQRKKNQPIEPDHKLFASSLDIVLLDEEEFESYDKAIVHPDGTSNFPYNAGDISLLWDVQKTHPNLAPLVKYLSCSAWNELDLISVLRTSIGELRAMAKEIDPDREHHVALVLQTMATFSVGLASCVGMVFQRYVQPKTQLDLSESLKVIIWGGKERYDFIANLRGQLLRAKGMDSAEELALPNWDGFVQLVRKILEYPRIAFQVPHVFQICALDTAMGNRPMSIFGSDELEAVKFGLLIADYVAGVSGIPVEAKDAISNMFSKKLSEVVHRV